jgi:pantothenate kinase type III
MLLAIDIGNTHLVLGIFKGDQLVHSWRVVTRRNQTFDEYAVLFRNLFELEGILRNMKEELGEAQVLATRGLASLVAAATEAIDRVEEDLILFGLRLFHSKLS